MQNKALPSCPEVFTEDAVFVRAVQKLSSKRVKQKRILVVRVGCIVLAEELRPNTWRQCRQVSLDAIEAIVMTEPWIQPPAVLFKVPSEFDMLLYFGPDNRNGEPYIPEQFLAILLPLYDPAPRPQISKTTSIRSQASLSKSSSYRSLASRLVGSPPGSPKGSTIKSGSISPGGSSADLAADSDTAILKKSPGAGLQIHLTDDLVILGPSITVSPGGVAEEVDRVPAQLIGRRVTHVSSTKVGTVAEVRAAAIQATVVSVTTVPVEQCRATLPVETGPGLCAEAAPSPVPSPTHSSARDVALSERDQLIKELVVENETLKTVLAAKVTEADELRYLANHLHVKGTAAAAAAAAAAGSGSQASAATNHVSVSVSVDTAASSMQHELVAHGMDLASAEASAKALSSSPPTALSDYSARFLSKHVPQEIVSKVAQPNPGRPSGESRKGRSWPDAADGFSHRRVASAEKRTRSPGHRDPPGTHDRCHLKLKIANREKRNLRDAIAALKQQIVVLKQRLAVAKMAPLSIDTVASEGLTDNQDDQDLGASVTSAPSVSDDD